MLNYQHQTSLFSSVNELLSLKGNYGALIALIVYAVLSTNNTTYAYHKKQELNRQTVKSAIKRNNDRDSIIKLTKFLSSDLGVWQKDGQKNHWIIQVYLDHMDISNAVKKNQLSGLLEMIKKNPKYYQHKLFTDVVKEYLEIKANDPLNTLSANDYSFLYSNFSNIWKNHEGMEKKFLKTDNVQLKNTLLKILATKFPVDKLQPKTQSAINKGTYSYDILVEHLKAQLKFKNYRYVEHKIKNILEGPNKYNKFQAEKLEKLYLESLIKQRHYTKTIKVLNGNHFLRQISKRDKYVYQADLYLRKGNVSQVSKIVNSSSLSINDKNTLQVKLGDYYFARQNYSKSIFHYDRVNEKLTSNHLFSEIKWRIAYALIVKGNDRTNKSLISIFNWSRTFKFEEKEDASRFCYWDKIYMSQQNLFSNLDCYKKYPNTFYGLLNLVQYNKYQKVPYLRSAKSNSGHQSYSKDIVNLLNELYQRDKHDVVEYIIRRLLYTDRDLLKDSHVFFNILLKNKQYNLVLSLMEYYYDDKSIFNDKYVHQELIRFDYPIAYQKIVYEYQTKYNLPEYLVNAVMREESKIRPEVESWAGAVGLMQVMPRTARYLNRFVKKKEQLDLKNPSINIQFGAYYLSRLLSRYDNNLYHLLAAYNAGPTNANRWIKRAGKNNIFFLESVSFSETRNYIKRVLKTYFIYNIIYEN